MVEILQIILFMIFLTALYNLIINYNRKYKDVEDDYLE